jgi:hypothetical protein
MAGGPCRGNRVVVRAAIMILVLGCYGVADTHRAPVLAAEPPVPLLADGKPVDWWFVFKLSSKMFATCSDAKAGDPAVRRVCPFGGKVQQYNQFSQQFVFASSEDGALQQGKGCLGQSTTDPVGATFDQIYNGRFFFVVWNDQFYQDPKIKGCSGNSCSAPWGHSKGMVAWDSAGQGVVVQVTTPSWPAAGSKRHPRKTDGNTLGCVKDNNVKVSQHFFALRLMKEDLLKVLAALQNASVVTDPDNAQLVNNGGPDDVQQLADDLGKKSTSTNFTKEELSTGVVLISKPSALHVPPWQMVSAVIAGAPLRTATWWAEPKIYTTTKSQAVECWSDDEALEMPGPVQIATTGNWQGKEFGLVGGSGPNFNHAKIGVSRGDERLAIFGDMNQQGSVKAKCERSQNGRGGLFYVLKNPSLHDSLKDLIEGGTAPTRAPAD